jgi:hypothetical protein
LKTHIASSKAYPSAIFGSFHSSRLRIAHKSLGESNGKICVLNYNEHTLVCKPLFHGKILFLDFGKVGLKLLEIGLVCMLASVFLGLDAEIACFFVTV